MNKTATTNTYRGTTESLVKAGTTTYAQGAAGSPLGQKVGTAAASYFLADPHGDTVGIVSTTATNQGTTAFDPYGRVLGVSGTQATFGFQSDVTDALTKAVDMGTRWYSPSQGAFSSRDVLFGDPMSPISLNQWVYGGANPITMHDPTGMRTEQCTGSCDSNTEQRNATAYSSHSSGSTWQDSYEVAIRVVPPPLPTYLVEKFRFSDPSRVPCDQCWVRAPATHTPDGGGVDPGCGGWNFWRCADDAAGAAGRCVADRFSVQDFLDHTLGGFIWAPMKAVDRMGKHMLGWSTIRAFASSPSGKRTLRGIPLAGLVFYGMDVRDRMRNDGNSLPRALLEGVPGAFLSTYGFQLGCAAGAWATRHPLGCAGGAVGGAWAAGTLTDEVTDSFFDWAVGPDLDG